MKSKKDAANILESLKGEKFNFSTILIGYRTREDLTQADFANTLGVSKSYICDLEKKRKFASVERAKEFAKKLKEPEELWVETVLQDQVDRAGMKFRVKLVA